MIMHLSISPHFPSPFLDTGPLEKSFWWESLFSSDKTTELIILKQKTKKQKQPQSSKSPSFPFRHTMLVHE